MRLREIRLIVRDLKGTKFRTAAVIISVAVLVSLLFSTSVLEVGSRRASQAGSEKFGADMMLLPPIVPSTFSYETASGPIFVVERPEDYVNGSLVAQLLRVQGVEEASPQLFVAKLNATPGGVGRTLVAFDPKTDFVIGAWFNGTLGSLQATEAVAGANAGVSTGDKVAFGGLTLRVVGILHPTNSSLDRTVLFPIETAYSTPQIVPGQNGIRSGSVSAVLVKLSPGASADAVEAEVKGLGSFRLVEATGLVTRVRVDTTGLAAYELLAEITMAVSVFTLMGLVFSMTTNERSRQLGLLRSLGATARFIFANVLKEAGLMAALGSAIGLALGELVVYFGEGFLVATFNTSLVDPDLLEYLVLIVRSVALGVVTGTAASVLPAYRVTRRDPYEAIRKGE